MIRSLLRPVVHRDRSSAFKWRYIDNLWPMLRHRLDGGPLSGEGARVLDELNRNGIATTSATALLRDPSGFEEMRTAVEALERERREELARARLKAGQVVGAEKTFIFQLLGDQPTLDPDSVFVRFVLDEPILRIVNAYFGMFTQLRSYNVWHTLTTQTPAQRSQLWHRDQEDRLITKVFAYFSDVDEGAGPFTYAAGSHPKGGFRREPESFLEKDRSNPRSTDEQMAAVVPPERWITAVGPPGTIIFADTRGYHKGGLARTKDRVMYQSLFVSRASDCKEYFERPARIPVPSDKARAFALDA